MSDSPDLARFFDDLRQRGFTISRHPGSDGYRIAEQDGGTSPSPRRLMMDSSLFREYVNAASSTWDLPPGTVERDEEIMSLMVTNVEATLTSVDANGRNHVTEIGLRRDARGRVEWYKLADPSSTERTAQPDPDLRWVAGRPVAGPENDGTS